MSWAWRLLTAMRHRYIRDFLHAEDSAEIIFTRNTTESINLVAYSYGLTHLKTGDRVSDD